MVPRVIPDVVRARVHGPGAVDAAGAAEPVPAAGIGAPAQVGQAGATTVWAVRFGAVVLAVLVLYYLLARRWRVHVELGMYRERLGVPRAVGWGMAAVPPVGIATTYVLGSPSFGGSVSTYDLALPAFVVGTFLAGWGIGRLPDYLALGRAERTATGAVGSGPVAVEGTARAAGEPLETPIEGEPCLCYRLRVRDDRALVGRSWVTVEVREDGGPFLLDDGSGPVAVDPGDAHLDLARSTDESVSWGYRSVRVDDEAPEYVRGLADRIPGIERGDRLQYREETVEPGDDAFVVGAAEPDGGSTDRSRADGAGVREIDDGPPGDGPADAASATVRDGGDYFLVSTRSGDAVRRRLRRIVLLGGTLGAVGAVGGYWFMLTDAGVL